MNKLERCYVDGETEFFNGEIWKKIKDYQESDKVLQYKGNGEAELEYPLGYEHIETPDPFYMCTLISCNKADDKSPFAHICHTSDSIKVGTIVPSSVLYNGNLNLDSRIMGYIHTGLNMEESVFSEEDFSFLYSSSYDSKLQVLDYLVNTEKYLYLNSTTYKVIDTLCSLSNWYLEVSSIISGVYKCRVIKPEIITDTTSNICTKVREICKKDKYCIRTLSGMIVLRREGRIYISVN